MSLRRASACLATLALTASAASAQDVQNFKPAPGTWNYFSVEGARVPRHTELVPTLMYSYGRDPLVVRDEDDKVDKKLVEHLGMGNVLVSFGLFGRLELGADIPVVYVSGDTDVRGYDGDPIGLKDSGTSLGDLRVIPKLRLFGLDPNGAGVGVGASISVPVSFPTGDKDRLIGSGQVIANPKLIIEARGGGFSFAANGGVRLRPEMEQVESLELGHEITYGAGFGVELGSEDTVLLGEVFGAAPLEDIRSDSRANPLEALMGLRFFTSPGPVITAGAGTGIVSDYGSPVWRALLAVSWHDRNYDRDLDGIPDKTDACPDNPEDKDNYEDTDGCPELDNDADGLLDPQDKCPNSPEDKDGFEDEDGCPDPDNDADGILDADDRCPNRPENYNKWMDQDGCPDDLPDTDADGFVDPEDSCPTDPEDKDGFQDQDGCPDPDNDNDRILDVKDRCPMQPETYNEFEDEDGCPDEKPTTPVLVRVTQEKIEILEKVYFHTNKATIKPESFEVLNQVADVMKRNEYIKRVRVEGHTDSKGNDKYNLDLSKKRAASVRKYLIDKGVPEERLEAEGYGETKPIDTNNTDAGRATNRRVEFTIVEP